MLSGTVNPGLRSDISNSTSLIVFFNLHSSDISLIVDGKSLGVESNLFLHVVQSPVRTNSKNVLSFTVALFGTVDHLASSVILDGSDARSG